MGKRRKHQSKYVQPKRPAAAQEPQRPGGGDGNAILRLLRYPSGSPIYPTVTTASRFNQVRKYRGWTYVAVRAIAEKIGQLRPSIGRMARGGGVGKSLSKAFRTRLKATTTIRDNEDIEAIEDTHPLIELLDNPNDPDVASTLWYRTVLYWELCGKAYWWLPRNNAGLPCEIWVLPTHWVTPMGGDHALVEKYQVQPVEGAFRSLMLPAEDIIPILHPSPVSLVDGYSPLDGGAAWVDQEEAMDSARWHQMANAHNAGMVLALEKGMEVPQKPDLDAAYSMLADRMRGPSKARMPLILPPGWNMDGRYGMTAEELDYGTSFDQIRDMVLALYKVPKGVLGIEPGVANTSSYAPNSYFFDHCINPKLHYLGQTLTEKLARRFDPELRVYWENSAPLDPEAERQKWNDAFDRGVVDQDQYAQAFGLPPVENPQRLATSSYVPMPTGELGVEPILGGGVPGSTSADSQEDPDQEPEKSAENKAILDAPLTPLLERLLARGKPDFSRNGTHSH